MAKEKRKKSRRSITISDNVWNEIDKYINCSKSEWIEKQMIRRISCNNDELLLQRKIESLNNEIRDKEFEKKNTIDKLKQLKEEKEMNNKNFKLIEDAMMLIRVINRNERAITKSRIQFIANRKNIHTDILIQKAKDDKSINYIENA